MKQKKIALTGNAGAGKSLVAEIFKKKGVPVIDVDKIGHQLLKREDIKQSLLREFGQDIAGPDGSIDRRVLGDTVFSDPAKLRKLILIMKPKLTFEVGRALAKYPDSPVVVDAALVFEYGLEGFFDLIVVVVSEPEMMIKRLVQARGYSPEKAKKILASQMPQEEKARRADFIIKNTGSVLNLEKEVDKIIQHIEGEEM